MKIFNLAPLTTLLIIFCGPMQGQNHKSQGADYLGPDWYKITSRYTDNPLLEIIENQSQEITEKPHFAENGAEEKTFNYSSEITDDAVVQNTSETLEERMENTSMPSWRGGAADH